MEINILHIAGFGLGALNDADEDDLDVYDGSLNGNRRREAYDNLERDDDDTIIIGGRSDRTMKSKLVRHLKSRRIQENSYLSGNKMYIIFYFSLCGTYLTQYIRFETRRDEGDFMERSLGVSLPGISIQWGPRKVITTGFLPCFKFLTLI